MGLCAAWSQGTIDVGSRFRQAEGDIRPGWRVLIETKLCTEAPYADCHNFMSWIIIIWSMIASACLTLAMRMNGRSVPGNNALSLKQRPRNPDP